jgi:hypothetical protein
MDAALPRPVGSYLAAHRRVAPTERVPGSSHAALAARNQAAPPALNPVFCCVRI